MIFCVQDPNASAVGGSFETGLFSPVNLLSSTFADELQMVYLRRLQRFTA
ncbi:MAG: hypothetical protein MZV63_54400 [Marinilabiliales bacterium]|nr:hypothetical protein [Marinilabiliales bacterium]